MTSNNSRNPLIRLPDKTVKRRKKSPASPQITQHEKPNNSNEPLFFYMPDAIHGEFCQWFPSTFTISKARIASLIGHTIDDADADADAEGSYYLHLRQIVHDVLQSRPILRLGDARTRPHHGLPEGAETPRQVDGRFHRRELGRGQECGNCGGQHCQVRAESKIEGQATCDWGSAAGRGCIEGSDMGHWVYGQACHVASAALGGE